MSKNYFLYDIKVIIYIRKEIDVIVLVCVFDIRYYYKNGNEVIDIKKIFLVYVVDKICI